MAKKRRGLGDQGLNALVSRQNKPVPVKRPARPVQTDKPGKSTTKKRSRDTADDTQIAYIDIALISPSRHQPRSSFDPESLAALAESIRKDGMLQPVVVRPPGKDGRCELIAGERRWRAAQECGLEKIPALVRRVSERQAAVLALVENLQREDLSPLEEAAAFGQLIEKFDLSHAQAAAAVGRSRSTITNLLRLLKLGPEARELLQSKRLEMGHARALLNLPPKLQAAAARLVAEKRLTVRETERLTMRQIGPGGKPAPETPPEIADLERRLSEQLGAAVRVRHGKRGGQIIVRYANLDVLDHILSRIKA